MAVFARGTLIRGTSGTGKSELALELIARGHRLVADDAVRIDRRGDQLFGDAPEVTAGVLAVSGLGLIDVPAVFGREAVQAEAMIELCIDLVSNTGPDEPDPLSDDRPVVELLDVPVPLVRLDVSKRPPGPVIIETAVKMLDHPSADTARLLAAKHDLSLIDPSPIRQ